MIRLSKLAAAAAIAPILCAVPALAKPLYKSLEQVVKASPTVVVATYVGPGKQPGDVVLNVESVLRGSCRSGPQEFGHLRGQTPEGLAPGGPLVAFIDAQQRLRWVGTPGDVGAPAPLERSVLHVRGFYDHNAHVVWPGFLTVDQLIDYLHSGVLEQTFTGNVWFLDPKARQIRESEHPVEVTCEGRGDRSLAQTRVTGLEFVRGLAPEPRAGLRAFQAGLQLRWLQRGGRSLELDGSLEGVDAEGRIQTRFVVVCPAILTQAEFERFAADEAVSLPTWRCVVEAGADRMPLVLRPNASPIGELEVRGQLHSVAFMTWGPNARELRFALQLRGKTTYTLTFDPVQTARLAAPSHGSVEELVQAALQQPLTGALEGPDGQTREATLRFEGIE